MVTCHIDVAIPKNCSDIDAAAEDFPDLLARSAEILRNLFSETLDTVPE